MKGGVTFAVISVILDVIVFAAAATLVASHGGVGLVALAVLCALFMHAAGVVVGVLLERARTHRRRARALRMVSRTVLRPPPPDYMPPPGSPNGRVVKGPWRN